MKFMSMVIFLLSKKSCPLICVVSTVSGVASWDERLTILTTSLTGLEMFSFHPLGGNETESKGE